MALTWSIVEATPLAVRLAADGATLLIAPAAAHDVELRDVIARFAPHLAFGPVVARAHAIERVAISGDERLVVGLYRACLAYVLASRVPLDIDDILRARFEASPFTHLAD